MTQEEVRKILNVGVLLSSERDLNKLLEHILSSVMELAHCDAGTLYLLAPSTSAAPTTAATPGTWPLTERNFWTT